MEPPRGPRPVVTVTPVSDTARKPLVLVVDDEEHITELLAMGLGYNGFDVERQSSGRGALAAIDAHRPDLIVLDVETVVAEAHGQQFGDVLLVVDDQDPGLAL